MKATSLDLTGAYCIEPPTGSPVITDKIRLAWEEGVLYFRFNESDRSRTVIASSFSKSKDSVSVTVGDQVLQIKELTVEVYRNAMSALDQPIDPDLDTKEKLHSFYSNS